MAKCDRCDRSISAGDLRYTLRVSAVPGDEEKAIESIPEIELAELIEKLQNADSFEIEQHAYEERVFTLCPICKHLVMENPIGKDTPPPKGDDRPLLH